VRAALVLGALLLAGCWPPRQLRDTQAVHNPDATRLWVIERDEGGRDRIVLCDVSRTPLCTAWYPETMVRAK
jgi:hypothetical protein